MCGPDASGLRSFGTPRGLNEVLAVDLLVTDLENVCVIALKVVRHSTEIAEKYQPRSATVVDERGDERGVLVTQCEAVHEDLAERVGFLLTAQRDATGLDL